MNEPFPRSTELRVAAPQPAIARPLVPRPAVVAPRDGAGRPAEAGGEATASPADQPGWLRRVAGALVDAIRALFGRAAADPGPATVPAGATTVAELHDQRRAWFISQRRGAFNPAENAPTNANCGPASLAMVAKAFGRIAPDRAGADAAVEDARRRAGQDADERTTTSVAGLVAGARSYGLQAAPKQVAALEDVAAELAAGKLVIASVVPTYVDAGATSGHFTVVTKVEGGKVYLNDPGKADGPIVVSAERFWAALKARSRTIVAIGR